MDTRQVGCHTQEASQAEFTASEPAHRFIKLDDGGRRGRVPLGWVHLRCDTKPVAVSVIFP
jgi:hypothetical protein